MNLLRKYPQLAWKTRENFPNFAPVIEVVRSNSLSESYLEYLRQKLKARCGHSLTD